MANLIVTPLDSTGREHRRLWLDSHAFRTFIQLYPFIRREPRMGEGAGCSCPSMPFIRGFSRYRDSPPKGCGGMSRTYANLWWDSCSALVLGTFDTGEAYPTLGLEDEELHCIVKGCHGMGGA